MTQDQLEEDGRIARALTAHAPPPLDAMFRIAVLERRERQRYRRRSRRLLAWSSALAALWVIGFNLGVGVFAAGVMAILVASLVGSCLVAIPVAIQLLRRLAHPAATK